MSKNNILETPVNELDDKLNEFNNYIQNQKDFYDFYTEILHNNLKNELSESNKKRNVYRIFALNIINSVTSKFCDITTPYNIDLLPSILKAYSDKDKAVREIAELVGDKIVSNSAIYNTKAFVPKLLESMDNSCRENTVIGSLKMLGYFADNMPTQIIHSLTSIIPVISDCMTHISSQVKTEAKNVMHKVCIAIDNKDIVNVIPKIIDAISDISLVPETIHDLASCTFVQTVDSATLSITVPLLSRGLKEKNASIKRQCAKICANMSKLVENPIEVESFLPALMPGLDKAREEVSDPEARAVCEEAFLHFKQIESKIEKEQHGKLSEEMIEKWVIENTSSNDFKNNFDKLPLTLVIQIILCMCESDQFELKIWTDTINTYYSDCNVKVILDDCVKELAQNIKEEEEDDAEELCNCTFTLAYGSKILLHNTNMKLLRGYRYGLLGGNDSGKTTLMRAIANEQVEGFPPGSELRTVFVEADILGELSDLPCIDYIFADERIKNANVPRDDIKNMLSTVGFSEKMI